MKNFALSLFARSLFALSFLVLVAAQPLTAQEKFTLKSAYPPGKYEMVMTTEMDMTQEMSSSARMPMQQTQKQYLTIDASERSADGTQKVVMEFTRIAMETKASMLNMKYDSADPNAANSPMKMMGVMVGLKLTMWYDKDNNVTKMEGMTEFIDKLMKDPDYPRQAAEMLKGQMTDESMVKSIDFAKEMMPKVPVAVGETWKTEGTSELPMLGKTKTNLENTLMEVKTENGRKVAVIVSKSTISSEEPKEMSVQPGMAMTITKMDVNGEITAVVDIESGLGISSITDMEMAIEMSMEVGDRTMAQKFSGKGKTTVTVTPKTSR